MSQNNIANILASINAGTVLSVPTGFGKSQEAIINILSNAIKELPDSPLKTAILQNVVKGTEFDPNTSYEDAHKEVYYDQAISRVGSVIFVDDSEWDSDEVEKVFDGDLPEFMDFEDAHDSNTIETVVSSLDNYIANLQATKAAILKAQAEGGKYITYSNSCSFDFENGRSIGD